MPDRAYSIGAVAACLLVIAGFMGLCVLLVFHQVPETPTLNNLLGVFGAMAFAALNYLIGSTASSRAKDRTIADMATARDKPAA